MEISLTSGETETVWTVVAGTRMHARVSGSSGDGPAVVMVHGLVVSSRYMIPAMKRLALRHRVYAPDLPGFGKSGKPTRAADVPGLSDALACWMRKLGLERSALVGNSMGCQIIVELAVRHPDLVERVVLQGPTMDPLARSTLRQIGRLLLDAPLESPSLLPIELLDYASAGTGRAWRTFRHALADCIEEKLTRVRAPALVVRGSRDPVCPQSWAEEAVGLLPEGQLVVLPGAAHTANYSASDEFVRAVDLFLCGNA